MPNQENPSDPAPRNVWHAQRANRLFIAVLVATLAVVILALMALWAYSLIKPSSSAQLTPTVPTPITKPSPTPTSNWHTYTSPELEFTFRYPPKMTLSTQEEILQGRIPEPEPRGGHAIFEIITYPYDPSIGLEELAIQTLCVGNRDQQARPEWTQNLEEFCTETLRETKEDVTINGTSAIRATYNPYEHATLFTLIPHEDKAYYVSISSTFTGASPTGSSLNAYEQILSTFQIINYAQRDQFTDTTNPSGFTCPDQAILDCSPCTTDPCPLAEPQYCSKGTPQYNFIQENCPNVSIIGLD